MIVAVNVRKLKNFAERRIYRSGERGASALRARTAASGHTRGDFVPVRRTIQVDRQAKTALIMKWAGFIVVLALAWPATASNVVTLRIEYSNEGHTLTRGESLVIAHSTDDGTLPAGARVALLDANTGALVDEKQLSAYSNSIDLEVPDFMELGFVEYRVDGELMLRIPSDPRSYLEFSEAAASRQEVPCADPLSEPHCDLSDASLAHAELASVDLSHRSLPRADLREARLNDADLSYADLSGASLYLASLDGANLANARLELADLTGASLFVADLQGADMRNARLINANLTDANLANADLTGADLRGADLTGADFAGARCPDGFRTAKSCTGHLLE